MQRTKKSSGAAAKVKKKMTKEQMQLAIIKKKECDAKALKIVMQLLEPKVDPVWLMENLKDINRCHMEDVIEERAITKLCGYVLCQKHITIVMNQRYHISLKEKKVYDISKRKNFCSSSCFGASNYLLEQMLTSPLWLRDKEEVPKFRIFTKNSSNSSFSHGEEVNITIIDPCSRNVENATKTDNEIENKKLSNETSAEKNDKQINEKISMELIKEEVSKSIDDFILETIKSINVEKADQTESSVTVSPNDIIGKDNKVIKPIENNENSTKKVQFHDTISENEQNVNVEAVISQESKVIETFERVKEIDRDENRESNNSELNIKYEYVNTRDINDSEIVIQTEFLRDCDTTSQSSVSEYVKHFKTDLDVNDIDKNEISLLPSSEQAQEKSKKLEKTRIVKTKKRKEQKVHEVVNLAARVEQSFQEWITEETIHFLFGDDSVKQKALEKIETQDRYTALCQKLNRLQFQEEQEDNEILEKPTLKPAPHFAVLQEEGQKLELKVRAFYQGKTAIEEPKKITTTEDHADLDTFLPLTDVHAPETIRQKIFLEKLDQVLPDLLRTLAGNNEVYAKATLNYTSLRCTAVKALIHTFSLSAKNIIFKTAEWTLVGLVIIKMLSLLDPWLTNLLLTKQANMYISMILTSYKLDPHYLNLLVASYNPNVNPR